MSTKRRSQSRSSSDEDEPLIKRINRNIKHNKENSNDSSSDSDIENYLQPISKIDLSSSFFDVKKTTDAEPSFEKIEEGIFSGVTRLSDSDDDADEPEQHSSKTIKPAATKLNFQQLQEYTKKIDTVKKHVDEYNAKKLINKKKINVSNLLAAGESKSSSINLSESFKDSDFETCSESEKEDWEEVKEVKERTIVPKEGLQITVDMPNTIRKKKGIDLLASVKRRLNRIKKENQILVHKVHLLCWLAHGNYINSIINSENILALSLSLLPSQHCYPADRTDLSYLEQILKWYKKTIKFVEKESKGKLNLNELIQLQINKKEVTDKKLLVYIFIAILRSLGIQCRLILSFQVEPLRPPSSELCSLSTKSSEKKDEKKMEKSRSKKTDAKLDKSSNSKSQSKDKVIAEKQSAKKLEDKIKAMQKVNKINKSESQQKTNEKSKNMLPDDDKLSKLNAKVVLSDIKHNEQKNKTNKDKNKASNSTKDEIKQNNLRNKIRTKSASQMEKPKSPQPVNKKSSIEKNPETNTRSKSVGDNNRNYKSQDIKKKTQISNKLNIETDTGKYGLRTRNKKEIPQVDGIDDSDTSEESIIFDNLTQIDGANDNSPKSSKPNLTKLKQSVHTKSLPKRNSKRLQSAVSKNTDSEDDFSPTKQSTKKNIKEEKKKTVTNLKKLKTINTKSSRPPTKSVESSTTTKKALDVRNDIIKLMKGRISEQKQLDNSRMVKKRKSIVESDDSDYMPEPLKKKHHESDDEFAPKVKVKRRVQVKNNNETENKSSNKKPGIDVWAEVFLETEEKWISVDVIQGQIHCVNELFTRATSPVSYIIAWNNNNSIKDITKRYCQNFNTITRKLRIDADWWQATLKPFEGHKTARDREEDEELARQQLEKPLPTSIAEYKNHPLYVLKRHLLKFEGIYPEDAATLGFVRKEAVYSRQCVYTLHSRDIWLKHAKVVKPGEKPYKIVKARPKYDKVRRITVPSHNLLLYYRSDQLLEIFGPWQVDDYKPPTAENGIVPRNAFGNVDLFKPCMLPKKTAHLQLPGLNKLARRMNIDCAPAITGFDFHGGWSHPVYDGFIVCEEFADTLIAAWELEQEEIVKRERDKIEKRVYGNWKKLIKGLLIRERLKARYNFGASTSQ